MEGNLALEQLKEKEVARLAVMEIQVHQRGIPYQESKGTEEVSNIETEEGSNTGMEVRGGM